MSEIKDGGSAFPIDSYMLNPNATEKEIKEAQGMSLRDYFAAAALQGLVQGEFERFRHLATDAYMIADCMLAERAKVHIPENITGDEGGAS
jgi:hypothetical protein